MKKLSYQGGLSAPVAAHRRFRKYVRAATYAPPLRVMPGGYVGSGSRTAARDRVVERALRAEGLGDGGVACWLTSTSGRHLMDDVSRRTTAAEFEKRVADYTAGAFLKIAAWEHPDHDGSAASTRRIIEKLRSAK